MSLTNGSQSYSSQAKTMSANVIATATIYNKVLPSIATATFFISLPATRQKEALPRRYCHQGRASLSYQGCRLVILLVIGVKRQKTVHLVAQPLGIAIVESSCLCGWPHHRLLLIEHIHHDDSYYYD